MDGQRFDELTKRLATGASRRSVLKALLGGAGAVAIGSVAKSQAAAQPECIPETTFTVCGPGYTLPATAQGNQDGVGCCNGNGNCCSGACEGGPNGECVPGPN